MGNRQTGPDKFDSYTYNTSNEMLNYSGHPNKGNSYEYDLNGNLIKKTETMQGNAKLITSYTYDDENRLITVTMAKGNKTKEISFAYDPFGRRISKTIEKDELNDDNSTNKKDYPLTTFYIYDEQNIIAEYDQTGKQTAFYIHGPNIDEPLAADIRNTRIYYHADGLGSITTLTNHMGHKVQQYDYDSFGNIKSTPFWIKQPFTYTAREFDYETGLYYYRARYYDPKVGRFVTKDPIGFEGGDVNLYSYVKNNPILFSDASGLLRSDMYNPIPTPAYQRCINVIQSYYMPRFVGLSNNYQSCINQCEKTRNEIQCLLPDHSTHYYPYLLGCKTKCLIKFSLDYYNLIFSYQFDSASCWGLYQSERSEIEPDQLDYWNTHNRK